MAAEGDVQNTMGEVHGVKLFDVGTVGVDFAEPRMETHWSITDAPGKTWMRMTQEHPGRCIGGIVVISLAFVATALNCWPVVAVVAVVAVVDFVAETEGRQSL